MYCTAGLEPMAVVPSIALVLHRLIGALSVAYIEVDENYLPKRYYAEYFSEESHVLFRSAGNAQLLNADRDPASFARLFALPKAYGNLIAPPPAFYASSNYKHFFESNGIYHVMDMAIQEGDCPKAIVGIFREKTAASFAGKASKYLPSLHAYLKHLSLQPDIQTLFNETDTVESATMVLDEKFNVQWMTKGAKQLLAYGADAVDQQAFFMRGRLPSAVAHVCQRLMARGTECSTGTDVPHVVQPLPGGCLSVRAHRIYSTQPSMPSMIAVTLNWQVRPLFALMQWCENAQVSERERQLLVQILRGKTGQQMADDMGIKLSTCKSYLQSAYRKLHVQDKSHFLSTMTKQKQGLLLPLREQLQRAVTA